MDPIILFWIDTNLCDGHNSSEQSMICEEYVIEINLACLLVTDKVAISVIDSVEQKAG